MAASSSSFQRGGERRGRWGSPERTVVWAEPKPAPKPTRKVAVVYYLCHRDGHLDHPHFLEMELPLSSSSHRAATAGLYLRDFTARLDALRGSGMPAMYAWSSKRSYRNGYVWQDLAEDDLVHPAHGTDEYVLKGSPLLFPQQPPPPRRDASSASSASSSGHNTRAGRRRKNWSSFDLGEYSNNKQLVALRTAQQSAATQTDHRGPDQESTELAIDEISPPPSSSSPDALDSCGRDVGVIAGGRMRASAVLMQLFSCGSMGAAKRGHARGRSDVAPMSASGSNRQAEADAGAERSGGGGGGVGVGNIMERDYFSGSLVESRKTTGSGGGDAALLHKRSSSCNADRGAARLKLPVAARGKVVRAGCLASRGSRDPKRNTSKSAAAASRDDGGECKGATENGAGSS
ncbi:hypothetical protein GQ55_3G329600 [Panicum hallii var. hallii]|uniref:SOSEKI DIX-like domain-containing protein n=1 Tax=Panicum hallii var. hallii TaxID=1504633 RepID=A0A2T7EFI4_9POAL|nr:hypothetical protein GQ55_3G329600 [Panicum hallii var. hallii]